MIILIGCLSTSCSNILVKYAEKPKLVIERKLQKVGNKMNSDEIPIHFKVNECEVNIKVGEDNITIDMSKFNYEYMGLYPLYEIVLLPCLKGEDCIVIRNDSTIVKVNSYNFYSYNLNSWQSRRSLHEIIECFEAIGYQCEEPE